MLQFTKDQVEGKLNDCFPHGSIDDLAIIISRNPSQLAQELNPNSDRESPSYRFLQLQCGLDQYDPELGEKHWQLIQHFRDVSKPIPLKNLCVDTETARAIKEDADCAIEHAKGGSLFDQLHEVNESIAQKHVQKAAILEAINKEKESFNGSTTRYAAREFAKAVVQERNGK